MWSLCFQSVIPDLSPLWSRDTLTPLSAGGDTGADLGRRAITVRRLKIRRGVSNSWQKQEQTHLRFFVEVKLSIYIMCISCVVETSLLCIFSCKTQVFVGKKGVFLVFHAVSAAWFMWKLSIKQTCNWNGTCNKFHHQKRGRMSVETLVGNRWNSKICQ